MRKRYVQLAEREPGVRRVEAVFTQDGVIDRPDVLPAPEQYSNLELLDMVLVDGEWKPIVPALPISARGQVPVDASSVLWSGHVHGLTGYGKSNREIMFRVSDTLPVQLSLDSQISLQQPHPDPVIAEKLRKACTLKVPKTAPLVRFYVPCEETENRYRICYTMMETYRIHPHFMRCLNEYYDEVWTPTHWNRDIMLASGVVRPIYVMPLGVDPTVFHPLGKSEVAKNPFTFLTLFQPTFRKGIHVMLPAFEEAFANRPDTQLILATTVHNPAIGHYRFLMDVVDRMVKRSQVRIVSGKYSEAQIADLYRSCDAYVTTSLGEGWNLPMCEAAACGLPVIAPRGSSHTDIVDDTNSFMVDPEGVEEVYGSKEICGWYEGMPFSSFGEASHRQLVRHFETIRYEYPYAMSKAKLLSKRVREVFTWDNAAKHVLERLSQLRS